MKLLAIDTSTPFAAVVVADGDRLHGGTAAAAGDGRHGRRLLPDIAAALGAAGVVPRDLDAIAIGLGPGSYTGLRVGLTAAKSLAFALSKPLVGLDSLAVIAENAPPDGLRVNVVVDAQRGAVYVAEFARDLPGAPLQRIGATRIEPLAAWVANRAAGAWVLGPALDRLAVAWPASVQVGIPAAGRPRPVALVELARQALAAGQVVDPGILEPLYIRRSAAEDQWIRRS